MIIIEFKFYKQKKTGLLQEQIFFDAAEAILFIFKRLLYKSKVHTFFFVVNYKNYKRVFTDIK
jgi:hypothetical protein